MDETLTDEQPPMASRIVCAAVERRSTRLRIDVCLFVVPGIDKSPSTTMPNSIHTRQR